MVVSLFSIRPVRNSRVSSAAFSFVYPSSPRAARPCFRYSSSSFILISIRLGAAVILPPTAAGGSSLIADIPELPLWDGWACWYGHFCRALLCDRARSSWRLYTKFHEISRDRQTFRGSKPDGDRHAPNPATTAEPFDPECEMQDVQPGRKAGSGILYCRQESGCSCAAPRPTNR